MRADVVLAGSGFPKLRSAVTLLRSEGMSILVDTGFVQDRPRLRAALAELGVAAESVDVVVATHLHYDHCGNHLLFPRARWIVGALDYADTRGFMAAYYADPTPTKSFTADTLRRRNAVIKDYYVRSIVREVTRNLEFSAAVHSGDGPFEPVTGPLALTSEIEILGTPGHTPGHLSVVARGAQVRDLPGPIDLLVAGDAIFNRTALHETAAASASAPLHLAADEAVYRQTRRSLLDRYAYVVPGHDELVNRTSPVSGLVLGRAS
jgi:glyoxylase-like metal-dependent hydrolase (beta-lactamase superfamily II)